MKKCISLILALAMLLTFVACAAAPSGAEQTTSETKASDAAAGADTENANKETRVITWMTTRSSWTAMNLVADAYMAEHENVKIEFEIISDRSSYNQKLKVLAANGELPDLFDSEGDSTLEEIASTGVLADVDELYTELGYDRMAKIGTEYARLSDGKLYSLAWENNVEYFFYHKDMFAAAGIEKTPETFDELLEVGQKLADAGYNGFAVWPGWELLRYLSFVPFRLTGNDFITELKAGEAHMSDPVGLQAAEFFQNCAKYFQPGWATSDYSSALETFMSGNAAMYYIGTWQFGSFVGEDRELAGDYGYFKLPTIEGATTTEADMYSNAGTGTSICKDKLDDQLKDFLKYVLDTFPETAFYECSALPPMSFDTTRGTFSEFDKAVMADVDSLHSYAYTWDVKLDASIVEVLNKEIVNLGMNQIGSDEFAARIDAAIAENLTK